MWFPSQNAKNFLNTSLDLPASGNEQDWEIELANPDRIGEFIDFYRQSQLSQDRAKALLALILASFEDAQWLSKFDEELWRNMSDIVRSEPETFREVLLPWVSSDEDDGFAISARVKMLVA